jgi:hypothetical protein
MSVIQDLLITNKRVLNKTIPALKKNPVLLIVGVPYGAVFIIGAMVAGMVGLLGGLVMIILQSAIISDYLSLINRIIHGHRVSTDDIRKGYKTYLSSVWSLLFLMYFIDLALGMFLSPINMLTGGLFFILAKLLVYIIFSAMPEVIYQKYLDRGDMVIYGLNFVKENALQWLLPNALLIGVVYGVYNGLLRLVSPIFGFGTSGIALSSVIAIIVTQGLIAFVMIYRGFLFDILSTSTMRKRLFMRHMYKD